LTALHKAGAFWYGDDLAYTEALMVSPQVYRTYLFPWLEELSAIARKAGWPFVMHTDGDVRLLIDDLVKIGLNALHPIEPECMSLAELKKEIGNEVCLIGNVSVDILSRGTVEQTRQDVARCFKQGAPGGGYMISSSNSIPAYAKPENVSAMVQAIHLAP
jgi:uroporphyrinogen decarboxylase